MYLVPVALLGLLLLELLGLRELVAVGRDLR
jgi:hypothetical protein